LYELLKHFLKRIPDLVTYEFLRVLKKIDLENITPSIDRKSCPLLYEFSEKLLNSSSLDGNTRVYMKQRIASMNRFFKRLQLCTLYLFVDIRNVLLILVESFWVRHSGLRLIVLFDRSKFSEIGGNAALSPVLSTPLDIYIKFHSLLIRLFNYFDENNTHFSVTKRSFNFENIKYSELILIK
jgi:hypothetical protein